MTPGGGEGPEAPAAGGPVRHVPVLLEAVLHALGPIQDQAFIDGTFGAGGYTRALLRAGASRVVAIDRDPDAIAAGRELEAASGGRLVLCEGVFGELDRHAHACGLPVVDGVVLDIGVSSMQLDEAGRGFSFRADGPLDMRMQQSGRSAADIVNTAEEADLADIIYKYGEERLSRRIARAIVVDRKRTPFVSTLQLASLVARLVPHKPTEIHPATRTFQGLRIAVNDELGELERALAAAERILRPGGRLVVVSFHSLEDRIVKRFLAERSGRGKAQSRLLPGEAAPPPSTFAAPGRQPLLPTPADIAANPRARSARLRLGVRTSAPSRSASKEN